MRIGFEREIKGVTYHVTCSVTMGTPDNLRGHVDDWSQGDFTEVEIDRIEELYGKVKVQPGNWLSRGIDENEQEAIIEEAIKLAEKE